VRTPTAPSHLAAIAKVEGGAIGSPNLSLGLESGAGADFEVIYDTYERGGPLKPGYPAVLSVAQPGASWLIFDPAKHGYDAVACGFRPDGARLRHKWVCDACGGRLARVSIGLAYNNWDVPDFQQMSGEFELADCFDWITIDLTCSACGRSWPAFLDYECA
jgi:hypothetical protein